MKHQGSKRGTTGTFLIKITLAHPKLLYFMSGPPKHLLRRSTYNFSLSVCVYIFACMNYACL